MKPRHPFSRVLFGTLVAFGLAGTASAIDIATTADATLTNDDASRNGSPDAAHGAAGSIEVRRYDGTRMRVSMARFDISTIAAGSDLSESTLSLAFLWGSNRTRDWIVYGLRDGHAGENWDEATVTYNTAPGVGPSSGFATLDLDIYDATTNPGGAWEQVGVQGGYGITTTPSPMPSLNLEAFLEQDTNGVVTLLFFNQFSDSAGTWGLVSKETEGVAQSLVPTLVLPNATAADSDGDGLPDPWEIEHFGTLTYTDDPGADVDTDDGTITGNPAPDGSTNAEELAAGSDPLDPLSVPTDIDADGLTDLWEDQYFGNNDGVATLVELNLQDGSGDPDQDDGTNIDEEAAGTDPNLRAIPDPAPDPLPIPFLDSEPDGLNDWWEIRYFGDTTTATDPGGDNDGDTATNQEEYDAFTDPSDPTSIPGDIDGDQLDDLWEDQYFGNNDGIVTEEDLAVTDETDGDPDMDGFTNNQESYADPVPSNPNVATSIPNDSDGDGLADDWEIDFLSDDIYEYNGLEDPDNDLYTNEEEENLGTDPLDPFDFNDLIDSDGDDQNDRWEDLYFGNGDGIATAEELAVSESDEDDQDMDGWFNYEEYEDGSDPTSADSVPGDIDGDGLQDDNEIAYFGDIYSFDGDDDPDRDYSTNLEEELAFSAPNDRNSWPDSDGDGLGDGWEMFSFGTLAPGEGGTDEPGERDPNDATIILSGDPDNDGYTNREELAAASNGNDPVSTPDSDGDGLPEGYEILHWGDATTQTGADDSDGDGASNRLEFLSGTNPTNAAEAPNPAYLATSVGSGADTFLTNDGLSGPGVVHGANVDMTLRNFPLPGSRVRIPMIRFDVSTLEGDLTNAMLRLNFVSMPRGRDLTVYGLVDSAANQNWDEATTSYSNAPGLVASQLGILADFARDPQQFRPIGVIPTSQGVTGLTLSDPNLLDLQSFIEADTDGLITLIIAGPEENVGEWYITAKEGATADPTLAPTLVVPNGTIVAPSDPLSIEAVAYDATAGTYTLTVSGLVSGQDYHVEQSAGSATLSFSDYGATITAAAATQDVVIDPVDPSADPARFFRVADGPSEAAAAE